MTQEKHQQSAVEVEAVEPLEQATAAEQPTMTEEQQEMQGLRFERTRDTARKLWQASLGAAVTLEHRSIKYFNQLVEKGAKFQYLTSENQSAAGDSETGKTSRTRSATLRAVDKMHDIEHSIEHGLDKGRANTLHWIGVSSRNELSELSKKVESLEVEVKDLQQQLRQQACAEGADKSNKADIT